SAPLLGVLRPEGDGGKRRLLCSFCLQEWDFRRIYCAACGEEDEKKLPVYVAEQFPHVRVESCETCKFYLRTIDLTKDGNAVPIVDDLAAIPLSLWAHEQGYSRLQPNLLGTSRSGNPILGLRSLGLRECLGSGARRRKARDFQMYIV